MEPEDLAQKQQRRWLKWAIEMAIVFGAFFAFAAYQAHGLVPSGEAAPALSLQDLQGKQVALSQLSGETVLVHFWATWCGVCQKEHGALTALHESGAKVLAVAADEDPETVKKYARDHDLRYPILLADRETVRRWRVNMFPTNYYVNPKGQIADRTVGLTSRLAVKTRMGCAR